MHNIDKQLQGADGIPVVSVDPPWQLVADQVDPINMIPEKIYGTIDEIRRTKNLCEKYIDIFSTSLRSEPADVPPMEINVDEKMWQEARGNRQPPRPQSLIK